jgi:hypothetical protein
MHQTFYLPAPKPVEPPAAPPKIIIINHIQDENSLTTKDSSKEEKTEYLRLIFFQNILKFIDKLPAGIHDKIKKVWDQILEKCQTNQMFDIDYLFQIYQEYIDFCFGVEMQPHSSIILSLFFQRISGPVGSIEKSADYAYRDLREEFNCAVGICCKVKRLILSLKTVEIKDDFEESVYRDLNLARVGYPYIDFITYQNKIDKQSRAMGLTKLECWEVKKAINKKLDSLNSLYLHQYFVRKYAAQAKQNINYYRHVLDSKIICLQQANDEKNLPQKTIDHKSKVSLKDEEKDQVINSDVIDIDVEIELSPDTRGDSFK